MSHTPPTLTEQIIGAAMRVHNTLGVGFLEKVYENALAHELRKMGFTVLQQHPIPVYYDGIVVGDYVADLVVEGKVVLELKTARALADEHTSICINYLHACKLPVCLLINFGTPRLQFKRLVGDTYINEKTVL
ncbi:MAG TPA: GxxExxY protein [Phycisphaerae bacterium]|nr:GxxExxY protein [Phycisphaerae bacterium]